MQAEYRKELNRKTFHMGALIFPFIYLFTPRITMTAIMLVITAFTIYLDRARHYNRLIQELVDRFFKNLMREKELSGGFTFSGASYMTAGFFITCLLFSKGIAITSWLVLIVSDSAAALVGARIGRPKNHGKSIEGAIAFFVTGFMISLLSYAFIHYNSTFFAMILACVAASCVEYYSPQIGVDDNLTIPVTFATVMFLFTWLL